ncbi:MAG: caspase family protein, partial [Methylobacterium sp.]|uniref:caspase family protein n=1 Tax=Methylobacterium sp. TaxID=409 RepID=UPI00258CD874
AEAAQARAAAEEAMRTATAARAAADAEAKLRGEQETRARADLMAQIAASNAALATSRAEAERAKAAEEQARKSAAEAEARAKAAEAEAGKALRELKAKLAEAPKAPPAVATGRRVALVIGNSAYRDFALLNNPRRDADAVANAFRSLGFQTVIAESNLSRQNFITALRRFEDQVESADWAVVYYAGHGLEVGGMNYLIPTDAQLNADRDIQDEAITVERVLVATEKARKLRLIVLDACRDNPFVPRMRRTLASTRSVGRGLAKIEPEGGTLVAFAARDGQVAQDGTGANSPFAAAFVKLIMEPGLEINMLFRRVRDEVYAATNRKQEPFTYGSLPGEAFYFRPK